MDVITCPCPNSTLAMLVKEANISSHTNPWILLIYMFYISGIKQNVCMDILKLILIRLVETGTLCVNSPRENQHESVQVCAISL